MLKTPVELGRPNRCQRSLYLVLKYSSTTDLGFAVHLGLPAPLTPPSAGRSSWPPSWPRFAEVTSSRTGASPSLGDGSPVELRRRPERPAPDPALRSRLDPPRP